MNPHPKAAVHPRWRLRFRFRFRAVFVFWVKLCWQNDGLFRHALWGFPLRLKLPILAHAPNRSLSWQSLPLAYTPASAPRRTQSLGRSSQAIWFSEAIARTWKTECARLSILPSLCSTLLQSPGPPDDSKCDRARLRSATTHTRPGRSPPTFATRWNASGGIAAPPKRLRQRRGRQSPATLPGLLW